MAFQCAVQSTSKVATKYTGGKTSTEKSSVKAEKCSYFLILVIFGMKNEDWKQMSG